MMLRLSHPYDVLGCLITSFAPLERTLRSVGRGEPVHDQESRLIESLLRHIGDVTIDLHSKFEWALRDHVGELYSRRQIQDILRVAFPDLPIGSVVPTDHAEPSTEHVNQCKKCAHDAYRIFDTVVDGEGKPHRARYRIRAFEPFPPTLHGRG